MNRGIRGGSLVFLFLVLVLVLGWFAGCGGKGPTKNEGPALGPTAKDGLQDLSDLLKQLADQKAPVPKSLADLAPLEPIHPAASAFIQNGSVVYCWGNGIRSDAAAAETVIAYDAQAAKKGGWVLMQDGSVKEMTAEQFNAAKKPPGRK